MLRVWRNVFAWLGWCMAAIAWAYVMWPDADREPPTENAAPSLSESANRAVMPEVARVQQKEAAVEGNDAQTAAPERSLAMDEAHYSALQQQFQNDESADNNDSLVSEQLWNFFGARAGQGIQVDELQCKSHLCRVVVRSPDFSADVELFNSIGAAPDSALGQYSITIPKRNHLDDGSIEAIAFIQL